MSTTNSAPLIEQLAARYIWWQAPQVAATRQTLVRHAAQPLHLPRIDLQAETLL